MSKGTCMICHKAETELKYLDLYVIGSEGLVVCHHCEMELVEIVRHKRRDHSHKLKEEFKRKKRERKVICPRAKEGSCKIKCSHLTEHDAKADCHATHCIAKGGPMICQEYPEREEM